MYYAYGTYIKWGKKGSKRGFLGCIFCAFLVFCVKNTGGYFFIWTLHMLCGIY